ncbi:FimB/Mfa2 family fimbrial subunit [Pedobacter sp. P351]|uniref:FimB/Mfa2 family fimbrial subunit n=1 Tax=Pedobacter superstes TaxID=3133441 RepID=UPI0030A0596E
MKIQFLPLFLLLIFCACKKQDSDDSLMKPTDGKFTISFNPQISAGFGVTYGSISHVSPNQMELSTRIYDLDNGGLLLSKNSNTSQKIDLPAGNYVAIFLASSHQFYKFAVGGTMDLETPFSSAFFDTRFSVALPNNPLSEIYYKKVYFTVSKRDINQTVVLEKIVSDLELVLEDEVPGSVSSLQLTVENDASTFNLNTDSRGGAVDKISRFDPISGRLNAHVLGLGTKTVIIRAYDNAGKLIKEKRITAQFSASSKTTVSGKLFNDEGQFIVSVNPV